MTRWLHRAGWATASVALVLPSLLAVPPSTAITDEFVSVTPTYLGDPSLTASNISYVTVPAGSPVTTAGPAAPYPSSINFWLPATILDVDLTIRNLTSTAPGDLNLLLVGPGGQQALVMSDIGASNDVSSVTFTFTDNAGVFLGDGTIIDTGQYVPQNQGGDGETFPAPAPALDGNSALSVFNGTTANGLWRLFVVDDQTDDIHVFEGWSLRFLLATNPYPNTITVTGLPPISDVNVKLNGLSSDRPKDAHFLLVGPRGQQAYLMGDAGAPIELDDIFLTLDDEAAGPIPENAQLTNGTYQPTRYDNARVFPAPAPVTTGSTQLSVFDGLDPDGQWSLFALDDQADETVSLDGWALEFAWDDVASPQGTVAIDGGAVSTGSRQVTLGLTAADPEGTGVQTVRFSNDGVSFSPYQPYSSSLAWTLSPGDGTKRVHAQFRDGAGNESPIVTDTITLDTTGPRAARLTPDKNATGVPTTAKVKIKASERLLPASVSSTTVFVKRKGTTGKVPAKVAYRGATRMLVITPRSPLARHTTYVVTVRRVKDLTGHPWDQKPARSGAQALTYSFSTG